MAWRVGNAIIECQQGDITRQSDIDAVVNAANAELRTGGGVAGAIHRAAGPGLDEECRAHAPIAPGKAVITGAHQLPNRHVIHCLGPVYGRDRPEAQLLADCYRNALDRAAEAGLASVAFPAISTGAFGYPFEEAAEVALDAVGEWLRAHPDSSLRLLRFVLYSADDQQRFGEQLERRAAAQ
jgi:O-acetyl-ADP-ribose deacetylase (regulator of RNase III)